MKLHLIMSMTVLLSSCVSSGLSLINGFANTSKFNISKNIPYGPHLQNTLDIYLPKSKKPSATIVFFYGGCWGQCSKLDKHHYLFVAEALTQQGYAVIIPDYRKYPNVKFNEIMEDAKNAVLWTVENSRNYGAENNSFFVMGHSAGAQMAAMLLANKDYLKKSVATISGFIGLAGPYNFYPFSDDYMYQLFPKDNNYFNSQPINFIDGDEPPFLIIQGKNDKKVNPKNATSLSSKLNEFKVQHELLMIDKKSHTAVLLNLAKPFRKNKLVLTAISDFVKNHSKQ